MASSSSAAAPPPPPPNKMISVDCVIDRAILNADTYPKLENAGLSIFAPLCGLNRGAFVMNPTDGKTYGCIEFGESFAKRAGVSCPYITDSNSIDLKYKDKNITALEAVDLIDLYVQSVYYSSGTGVAMNTHGCDVSGLAKLVCATPKELAKIRAVTLPGALNEATWVTGGKPLTLKQARNFYTSSDFQDIAALGLNTVQIPCAMSKIDAAGWSDLLTDLIHMASKADLRVVVSIEDDLAHTKEDSAVLKADKVKAAAHIATSHDATVTGLILPAPELVAAARGESTTLPLFLRAGEADLPHLRYADDPNIYLALDRDHITSLADIASSDSKADRSKLFYHENMACPSRSPIEYAKCYKNMPAYIFHGFNVAIDDCIRRDVVDAFHDYGQCDRLNETITSPWWFRHRQSYLDRQIAAYETGMGWTYDAWKLSNDVDSDDAGVLDDFAKLLALKNVAAAGLFPSSLGKKPHHSPCLNNPVPDFDLGDETLAPTAGPPPDCGNGWWNFNTSQCDYWIPPPPTPAPTPCPEIQDCETCSAALTNREMAYSASAGAAVVLVVGGLIMKFCCRNDKREGYTSVPNAV